MEAAPGAVVGEVQERRLGLLEDEGAAIGPDADELLDARGGQAGMAEEAAEPADQVLGEQDQFLVDGDTRLVAGGQVAAGEDALAFLDSGLDGLASIVEGADAADRPLTGAQLGVSDEGGPAFGLAFTAPLATGEQADRVGVRGSGLGWCADSRPASRSC